MDHALTDSRRAAVAASAADPTPPDTVARAFEPSPSLPDAENYTRQLTHGHYENFSVVSLLLPKRLRQDFCNVYAFCRTADDLADEVPHRGQALSLLNRFREETHACYADRPGPLLFAALHGTIRRHDIPEQPFLDLIDAFEQDQRVDRYGTFEEVVDYCRRSADPVGRLVLYMCGHRDAERQRLSDRICTALQVANFLQDVRRDLLERDRIYLPADSMRRFGVSERSIREGIECERCDEAFRELMRFETRRTEAMFDEGERLLPLLDPPIRRHIGLFAKGGRAVLAAIRKADFDTLARRPVVTKMTKAALVLRALTACAANTLSIGGRA